MNDIRSLFEPRRLGTIALALAATALLSNPPRAQEPYDEDEWYDPTDWFDGNNVEWDDTWEWWDEGRRNGDDYDPYGYDPYWYDGDGYGAYDLNDESHYGWHYEWNPIRNQWERRYGVYDDYYDFVSSQPSYGWYYEWDAASHRWRRTRGWHDQYYEYPNSSEQRSGDQQSESDADRDRGGQSRDQGGTDGMQGDRGQDMLSGRIQSFNRVQGADGERTLVQLRMQDGRTRFVDFGTRNELDQLGLQTGDRISIRGRRAQRDDRDVFIASAVTIDGERRRIRRPSDQRQQPGQQSGQQGRPQQGRQQQQQQGQQGRSARREVTFGGRLDGFHEVRVRGARDRHLLVRMTMQDGKHRVVDLGPTNSLGRFDLNEGDRVTVRGRTRQVGDKIVLVADRLRVDGEQMDIRGPQSQQGAQQQHQLAGEVDTLQRVHPDGLDDHLILRVQLQNGTSRLVDFGKETSLAQLGLKPGDQVRIAGRPTQRQGEQVFVARDLRVNGESYDLNGTSGTNGGGGR